MDETTVRKQYRWNMLAEYAQSMSETAHLPALCQSDYEKGLLEWRVSTEAATSFLGRLPQDDWLEVSYSTFGADPFGTTSGSPASFISLPNKPCVTLSNITSAAAARVAMALR